MKKTLIVDINIPYCIKRSEYFQPMSVVGKNAEKDRYMYALLREIDAWEGELDDYEIAAVRLGGGNATVMSPDLLGQALCEIRAKLPVAPMAQFSFDAVPNTIGTPCLTGISAGHVTRAELIMRSQKDSELKAIDSAYKAQDISNALMFFNKFRFNNVGATVNFGLPGQTTSSWYNSLRFCPMNGIRSVRIEPTARAAAPELDEEARFELFKLADNTLRPFGYKQYAAGCFASEGFEDRFELLLDGGADVLGLGAGAVTVLDGLISRNTNNINVYTSFAGDFEKQTAQAFSPESGYFKKLFVLGALRKGEGLSEKAYEMRFEEPIDAQMRAKLDGLCEKALAERSEYGWKPTLRGLYLSLSSDILSDGN